MLTWIVLPVLGAVVGTLSGLLGIGGGIVLVPMLATILPYLGVGSDVAIHLALGSALATSSFTLFSSGFAHKRHGNLDKHILYIFLPGIILGAIVGPYIVHLLPATLLRNIIGLMLLALAINMAFDYQIPHTRTLPNRFILLISVFVISLVSSFAGLSGAVFIVPYLVWFATPMRKSVGTAAMCGLPLSIVGMISYMVVGYNSQDLPAYSVGYVYWPAVILISLTSMPAAQLAAKFSSKLPKELLKRLLAIVLTIVACKMLFF